MEKENGNGIKIIFSLISLFLMIPPLIGDNSSYYRTLFIFLINRVIDMFYKKKSRENIFFVVWSLLNQWMGALACAVAFCSIAPEFATLFSSFSNIINMILFMSAISCVLKELSALIVASVQENLIEKKIKSDMSERKGEFL